MQYINLIILLSLGLFSRCVPSRAVNQIDLNTSSIVINSIIDVSNHCDSYYEHSEKKSHLVINNKTRYDVQFSEPYTIYEICGVIDLNGQTLTLKDGCTLFFNGGLIKNGTVIGNNTCIRSDISKIFNNDVNLLGSWNVTEAFPEWFGAKGDGQTDDRIAIQKTVDVFPYTVLQSKHYLINSVNNNKDRFGITLSRGKRLSGIRMYCSTFKEDLDNITLVVGENLNISSVVRVTTLCELSHIGIIGNMVNPNCSCVSSDQASRMILNNVAVAKSNIGFDMHSYLSRYSSCFASYCKVGFSIQGESVKNTSNILETCQAIDCPQYGFYFNMITYSTLISCAADGCGTHDVSNLGYAYYIEKSDCMSFISCGCEQCLKPIFCQQTKNTDFTNCNFLVDKHHLVLNSSFKLKDIINIRHSEHISIKDCIINYTLVKNHVEPNAKLIQLYGSKTNTVVLSYTPDAEYAIGIENIGSTGFIDLSKNLRYFFDTQYHKKGNSKERPVFKEPSSHEGYLFFDTTLSKPIWWNGKCWVDVNGNKM